VVRDVRGGGGGGGGAGGGGVRPMDDKMKRRLCHIMCCSRV
jgi:hypothetical protein